MRGRRLERRVRAYLDGALEGAERDRIEQLVETDPEAIRVSRRHRALTMGVRAAWSEGPAGPDHANLMASIRPEMMRIDAEIVGRPAFSSAIGALREALRPLRVPVLAGSVAAVAFLMYVVVPVDPGIGNPTVAGSATSMAQAQETIYDLRSDDGAVMIFEAEGGATVIYVLDESDRRSKQPLPTLDWSDYHRDGLA